MVDFELAKVDLAVATGTLLGFSQVYWSPLGTCRKASHFSGRLDGN